MTRRFVVLTESSTPEQDQAFQQFIDGRLAWWRWFPNSWVLIDRTNQYTSDKICGVAAGIYQNVPLLVVQFDEDGTHTWHAMQRGDEMFKWFHTAWEKP
jgi:hypothetical protein